MKLIIWLPLLAGFAGYIAADYLLDKIGEIKITIKLK